MSTYTATFVGATCDRCKRIFRDPDHDGDALLESVDDLRELAVDQEWTVTDTEWICDRCLQPVDRERLEPGYYSDEDEMLQAQEWWEQSREREQR